eukprot:359866-Chlamydomonas_euryale.AAC.3
MLFRVSNLEFSPMMSSETAGPWRGPNQETSEEWVLQRMLPHFLQMLPRVKLRHSLSLGELLDGGLPTPNVWGLRGRLSQPRCLHRRSCRTGMHPTTCG